MGVISESSDGSIKAVRLFSVAQVGLNRWRLMSNRLEQSFQQCNENTGGLLSGRDPGSRNAEGTDRFREPHPIGTRLNEARSWIVIDEQTIIRGARLKIGYSYTPN